jgi:predicted HNH restriction endonuclease
MLINKFKLKYGNNATITKYIDNEVAKFLKNDRLSEDNLKRLDEKINKEADLRAKKEGIVADRQSQKEGDARSTISRGSQRQGKALNAAALNILDT